MNTHSGSATLPKGFRYAAPRTPEPLAEPEESPVPSAPRPRLKLKKRHVSRQLAAPTQQFLASIAAADVPIPSIEEPQTSLELSAREMTFSPPKTPTTGFVPALAPTRYPDWTVDSTASSSLESSPDYGSGSRPSTSRSTQTSASFFSRQSQLSDERCPSPDDDSSNREDPDPNRTTDAPQQQMKSRKAAWTKAMSDHVWNTYNLYLQDPKVTPFRMGNSCIPPHGVLLRVAREARRSWKGRAEKLANRNSSGSKTPTGLESSPFIEWPHTCASTRAHLRHLCRLKASSGCNTRSAQTAARRCNRRSTPARSPSVFGIKDMSMSLAISTSDSMQPDGPLARLTNSIRTRGLVADAEPNAVHEAECSTAERGLLGSPLSAQSYGPSSTHSLAAALELNDRLPRQNHTMGPTRRTLQSPIRMTRSSSTSKRVKRQSSAPRKRPSIVSDIFLNSTTADALQAGTTADFSSTQECMRDKLFIPRAHADPVLPTSSLAPAMEPVARLASPFDGSNPSFTFPNRSHSHRHQQSVDLGVLGRPFASSSYPTDSSEAIRNTHLTGRFAYMDQRLRELQNRDASRKSGSDSPM